MRRALLAVWALVLATGCEDPPDTGMLIIAVNTLPTDGTLLEGMRALHVHSTRVDVVLRSDREDPASEEVVTVNSSPEVILLSGLASEGIPSISATLTVPAGFVAQVRVIVSSMAVTFDDGTTALMDLELEVGSGKETGIKIIPDGGELPWEIRRNELTTISVTYDAAFQVLDPDGVGMDLRMKPVLAASEVNLADLPSRIEDYFLLRFVDGTSELDKMALFASLGVGSQGEMAPNLPVEVVNVPPGGDIDAIILDALSDPIVDWASTETFGTWAAPNPRPVPGAAPSDPLFDEEFFLLNNGAGTRREGADVHVARPGEAWDLQIGDMGVIVAIADTGIMLDHPDLIENLFLNEGELPANCRAGGANSLDFDADGIVTFRDLNNPPSMTALAACNISEVDGNPEKIDPLDLIATLSDGADDDLSGVIDDFCGADFSRVFFDPACPNTPEFCPEFASNVPSDLLGHGTKGAGLIGSVTDNGDLLAGIDWYVRILPIATSPSGDPSRRSVRAYALGYAAHMGAHVTVIMEQLLPSQEDFDNISDAERAMRLDGIRGQYETMFFDTPIDPTLIVWSAGQWKFDCDDPAELCADWEALRVRDNLIVVGGTNWHDLRWSISNTGVSSIDIGAPADSMPLLELDGGYRIGDGGTSMAAAITGGVAALLVAHDDTLRIVRDPARLRDAILNGADDHVRNLDESFADGRRLNATGALNEL